jgi:acetyl/propionyl-CoA carboxylase alpha subunit
VATLAAVGLGKSATVREVAGPRAFRRRLLEMGLVPGTVVRVAVAEGDAVGAGQIVLVLEAMKMQHTVTAPHAGTVTRMSVHPGAQVAANEVLAVVEEQA